MKKVLLLLSMSLFSWSAVAENNDAKARSLYFAAEAAYEEKDYTTALDYLNKTQNELGKTNPVLSALRIKSLYEIGKFSQAKKELDHFYQLAGASDRLSKEMARYLLKIDAEIASEKRKRLAEAKKQAEAKAKLKTVLTQIASKMVVIPSGSFDMGCLCECGRLQPSAG